MVNERRLQTKLVQVRRDGLDNGRFGDNSCNTMESNWDGGICFEAFGKAFGGAGMGSTCRVIIICSILIRLRLNGKEIHN